jgi:hypothetical protein
MNSGTRAVFLAGAGASALSSCAAWNLVGGAGSHPSLPAVDVSAPAPPLVTPQFLIGYPSTPQFVDYRPAIDRAGSLVLFERTPVGQKSVNLFLLELGGEYEPARFVSSIDGTARCDWSWKANRAAFSNAMGVWTAAADGSDLTLIPNTAAMVYPAWYPSATALATYNSQTGKPPLPHTSKIDLAGRILIAVCASATTFAGFPSVNPTNPHLIAFAGQPVAWDLPGGYDQDYNYVFIADTSTDPHTVKPLDPRADLKQFDPAHQGRAPYWSPDGKWIAFESGRFSTNGDPGYAICIQDSAGKKPAMQVTDTKWNGQHPKWYASGTQLVAAVLQEPVAGSSTGIASLDVSAFVSHEK